MADGRCDLTVVILTFDEAHHIARAIESVRAIARDILVIDSFSSDATVTLAEAAGARVVQHAFVNHAAQFQWALDRCGIATGWTMRLDADELIEPDLAAAIARTLPTLPADVTGISFDRKHIFMGRWIRHGGRYPLSLLRVCGAPGAGGSSSAGWTSMSSSIGGRTIALAGGFADANLNDLSFFTAKHNGYATREAIEVLAAHFDLFGDDAAAARRRGRRGASAGSRTRIYNRLPLWVGPTGYFLFRYVVQRGFFDGRAGLIYHVLQGFWYRFLVAAKVAEWGDALAQCGSRAERIARLAELTGLPIGGDR